MESARLLQRVQERYTKLTRTERKIADFYVSHQLDGAFLSAARVASALGVSESSILRFAKTLGYRRHRELQREIQTDIRHRLKGRAPDRLNRSVDLARSDWEYFVAALGTDVTNIEKSLHQNTEAEFMGFVDALLVARTVYVIGMRGASSAAALLAYTMNMLLPDVRSLVGNVGDIGDRLLSINGDDVLLACAFSRHATLTMQVVEIARKEGAIVLGLTDDPLSPLATASDYRLVMATDSRAFIQSYAAVFSVIHGLIGAVGSRNHDFATARLSRLEGVFAELGVFHPEEASPNDR